MNDITQQAEKAYTTAQKAYTAFLARRSGTDDDFEEWGSQISCFQQLATHYAGATLYGFSVQKTIHTEAPDEFESKGRVLTLNMVFITGLNTWEDFSEGTLAKDARQLLVGMPRESRENLLNRSISTRGWDINFDAVAIDLSGEEVLGSHADSTGDLSRLF